MLTTTFLIVAATLVPGTGPATAETSARRMTAPAAALQVAQDPADSLYREARAALGRGDYSRSAELFARIAERHASSAYAGEALYYTAFSLYRVGGTGKLRQAIESLTRLRASYPAYTGMGEANTLRTRVCGELARRGDEGCAAEVAAAAASIAGATAAVQSAASAARASAGGAASAADLARIAQARAAAQQSRSAVSGGRRNTTEPGCPAVDEDTDERVAALNALLQMDAARAMPILTQVLDRRDACSAMLRRKAVFLVSQKRTPETADILLKAARSDPDQEVREQAVFWLSQVSDERAVDMLQEILRSSGDDGLQNKALFALSQHRSPRASQLLREFALREGASDELRAQAVFWLGQRRSQENADFLRNLFARTASAELKDRILFSLSQQRGVGNDRFLLEVATNTRESVDIRKKAIFWAGQGGASTEQLVSMYASMPEPEMREQLIFVYSQRREPAVVDKLFDIARSDANPELRRKAIFWLGQSRDPRVQQFLLDLINR